PVGVVITDTEGKIEYVNPQFLEMTGYTGEELYGQNPRILKSGETPQETYQELWGTITAGGQWRGEFHNRKKNGVLYWDRTAISPIRDSSGAITHFLAVKENITREKAREAQYLNAQKLEAVGRLAGGIAHDFNNMLSVIMGYTEAVLAELKPIDPIYKDLEQVQFAANRSAELTRQLLAFSRQQTIAPVVIDLNAQLNAMEELLRRLIGEDVDIQFVLSRDLWHVVMDPSQVDQIVTNLAVNARDAMPDGGKLTIETANVRLDEVESQGRVGLPPGDYAMLAVSDTGCGMDAETAAHIYEPFFTTKSPGKGTGLGLATVYGAVKQNKGAIQVYSEPDEGTTFRIYLPRYIGEDAPAVTAARGPSASRGHETILLVEDDVLLRTLARRMLERHGYRVLEALGPGEAIALCERHAGDIHLLLTDVVLPVMNGKELKNRVCSLRPGVKVLYMSGYTADAIAHRGVLERGTHFIAKPFTFHDIGQKVRQVLDAAC
ncbi:MAG TPA: PAS domain S-box protein, partial [Candidatus Hydrogenedentes bacterium]|nr:PAS domain S-box protein [Candidatus Hydrogenedentota bacterium]